jgi:hypothetical protein
LLTFEEGKYNIVNGILNASQKVEGKKTQECDEG